MGNDKRFINMKNLKEELKRMKSLFNSDRLYGNIINEATNPDTNSDGKIDSTEFSTSGDEISYKHLKYYLLHRSLVLFFHNLYLLKIIYLLQYQSHHQR